VQYANQTALNLNEHAGLQLTTTMKLEKFEDCCVITVTEESGYLKIP